jgi:WD40 repeat protein
MLSGCGGSSGPQPDYTNVAAYGAVSGKNFNIVNTKTGLAQTIVNSDVIGATTFVGGGADVAVVSGSGVINIYNVSTGSLVGSFNCGYTLNTRRIASSPDGKHIAVAGDSAPEDTMVKLWNQQRGMCDGIFDLDEKVEAIAYSPDGRYLAAGGEGGAVKIWNISTASSVNVGNNTSTIETIAFSPDGQVLATANTNEKVRFWKTSDGTRTGSPADISGASVLFFLPDGNSIATAGYTGTLHKYRVADGADEGAMGPAAVPYRSSISRDFKTAFIWYDDKKFRMLDTVTGGVSMSFDTMGTGDQFQDMSW